MAHEFRFEGRAALHLSLAIVRALVTKGVLTRAEAGDLFHSAVLWAASATGSSPAESVQAEEILRTFAGHMSIKMPDE